MAGLAYYGPLSGLLTGPNMMDKLLISGMVAMALSIVGKIVFDWLKNKGSGTVYDELKHEINSIRTDFDTKLDAVIAGLNDLNMNLAKNYVTQDSIVRIWNEIEEIKKEMVNKPCQRNAEAIENLKEKIKDLKK
jgi:hypothetical protein